MHLRHMMKSSPEYISQPCIMLKLRSEGLPNPLGQRLYWAHIQIILGLLGLHWDCIGVILG